jgi:hypothetical protein
MRLRQAVLLTVAAPLAVIVPLTANAAGDKAGELLASMRQALGGKVESVNTLSATGEFRRMMGDREMNGDLTIELIAPDKFKRTEDMGIPGGPQFSRTTVLNGSEFWEDSTNRGGGGGNVMRFGGPGGPGAPGGPGGAGAPGGRQGPSEEDRQRFRQMQQRRLTGELQRDLLLLLGRTTAPATYVGEAEASDGKADVIEVKPDGAAPMRLFLDQQTHMPLMLTYTGVMPRMVVRQAGTPPPSPEEMRKRWEEARREPPQEVTYEVHLEDYKDVNGVMLPHRVSQSVDGKPTEEWTVSTYKVNPNLKPESFVKKGS